MLSFLVIKFVCHQELSDKCQLLYLNVLVYFSETDQEETVFCTPKPSSQRTIKAKHVKITLMLKTKFATSCRYTLQNSTNETIDFQAFGLNGIKCWKY